jgi:hypothetical protein
MGLGYASERLKDNKEIVMIAVGQSGGGLLYASKRLRNDQKFRALINSINSNN